jgi:hypothetical protein
VFHILTRYRFIGFFESCLSLWRDHRVPPFSLSLGVVGWWYISLSLSRSLCFSLCFSLSLSTVCVCVAGWRFLFLPLSLKERERERERGRERTQKDHHQPNHISDRERERESKAQPPISLSGWLGGGLSFSLLFPENLFRLFSH